MTAKQLAQGAVIAAVYAVLTLVLAPLSYGMMQVRVSEALCVLPMFTPAAVPGLFIGCFVANMLGPNGVVDVLTGSAATLIAAIMSYKLRDKPKLVPLPPVIANAVIVGWTLSVVYGLGVLPACMFWVGLGEAIACYVLGYPLIKYLQKHKDIFRQ